MSRFKRYWLGVGGQVLAGLKRFMRDKTSLFFTFLFPLLFLFVFGSIFNNKNVSFRVAIINHSESEFAQQFLESAKKDQTVFKIQDVADFEQAKQKMRRSQIDVIVELPVDFGVIVGEGAVARPSGQINVFYSKGADQTGSTFTALMEKIIGEINYTMGHPMPPLTVKPQALGDERLSDFDYTFTGLLAFSLMSMGVFGLANAMPTEKQKGSYRRLRAAPFTSGQLIIAMAVIYTLISLISAALMVAVGMLFFNFQMRGSWLLFVPFLLMSATMMVGLGLLVGSWAKNENQSAPLSNLISFPMMFLSGAFFPSFLFPEWLQSISKFIPMTPLVDGFRMIMAENASPAEILPYAGGVLACIVIIYALAIKLFRWE